MRVLMLSWEYPPHVVGGLGKHVAELLPALGHQDVRVHLITPTWDEPSTREEKGRLYIHRVQVPVVRGCAFFEDVQEANKPLERAARGVLATHKIDLVHNHDWLTFFAAQKLKHNYKLPLIATIHATERGRGQGALRGQQAMRINDTEWQLTYEAWRVICCTHYMANEIQHFFQTPADKIDVIPNGVDPTPFQSLDGIDLAEFRAGYAAPEDKIVFYVGRVVYEKGVEFLIRAVPLVIREIPRVKFLIAGKGPELPAMQSLAQELGITDKVTFLGFVSNETRDRLFKVADCAVFPSLYEPFGIVALEAMAARVPVVASDVGGLREVVRHGETGITIYPGDAASCAWGILHTFQHPEWARMRVENAYRAVLNTYNWDTIAAQTRQVYERVARERAQTIW